MLKKFSFYTLAMLLIPIVTWLVNWHWSLAIAYRPFDFDYFLYLITETGTFPYAIATSVSFTLLLAWLVRERYPLLLVVTVCVASIGSTQVIKSGLKTLFEEPRPFVTALFQDQTDDFYRLPRKQRHEAVIAQTSGHQSFVTEHQAKEVGYSFPSGHTVFAVSWLLLFVGFCLNMRTQAVVFLQFFAIGWAALMLISRLRLGMHYPIDLFVGSLIALVTNLALFSRFLPWLERQNLFNLPQKRTEL